MVAFIFELIPGVIASIIATIIWSLVVWMWNRNIISKSPYSGEWESCIYDDEKNVVKKDRLILSEANGKIRGEMKRITPIEQNNREWKISGFVKNGHILLSIIAKNETQASDGSVYVVHKGDEMYEGFYLKNIDGLGVTRVPICLKLKKRKK